LILLDEEDVEARWSMNVVGAIQGFADGSSPRIQLIRLGEERLFEASIFMGVYWLFHGFPSVSL
jgi:hypothetical protein